MFNPMSGIRCFYLNTPIWQKKNNTFFPTFTKKYYKLKKNFISVLSFPVFIFFCYASIFREFLWTASLNNMANGEFVFITLELFPSDWLGYYMKYIKSKCKLFLSNNYFNTYIYVWAWGRRHQCLSVHNRKKNKKQT